MLVGSSGLFGRGIRNVPGRRRRAKAANAKATEGDLNKNIIYKITSYYSSLLQPYYIHI